jgi:hypothetical protein
LQVWRERFKRRFEKPNRAKAQKRRRQRRRVAGLQLDAGEDGSLEDEAIETEQLVLDDPRLDDMLSMSANTDVRC